jgi:hypothetical protein
LFGLAFSLGVVLDWAPLNGLGLASGIQWPWRDLDLLPTAEFLLAPLALIAGVLWRMERTDSPAYARWLWVLAAANFLLQLLGMEANLLGIGWIRQIVMSPGATSYFTDALAIHGVGSWLGQFHEAILQLHSTTHPPGPILFYYVFVRFFGPSAGAMLGGCSVGLLGSLGVVVMYRFAALWTGDAGTRFLASAVYALIPSLVVFFPEFDQVYPILSMGLILLWVEALTAPRRSGRNAVLVGATLFVSLFFAYNLAVTGVFLAYFALYWLWRQGGCRSAWLALFRTGAIALAVVAGFYLVLGCFTGFQPVASFRSALAAQALIAPTLNRPYHAVILVDPYCFLIGAGVVALPILLFQLRGAVGCFRDSNAAAMTLIGLATILTVDAYGHLGETARVWMFLQPLVVVPVALALASARWQWRLSILAMQWWILVCLKARFEFLAP